MEIICFRQNLVFQCQQCVHIHHQNIHCHIGNVFCVVVRNFHIWILQVHNQISTIQILASPYVFIYINTFHVVMFILDALSMKINSVNCVRLIQMQFLLQNFITENVLW